jgi:hypothetical protein
MLPAWRLSVSPRQLAILVTTVPHTVWTFPFGSALRWVSPPAILLYFLALWLVSPATMASADFCRDRSRQRSPQVIARCFAAQPPHLPPRVNQTTSLGCASSSCRVGVAGFAALRAAYGRHSQLRSGSMRFSSIGLQLSPSLSPHGRSPFRSWL